MNDRTRYNILYSCSGEPRRGHEPFVAEHALTYITSGEMCLSINDEVLRLPKGSIAFLRRNQLVKAVKLPDVDRPFMSVNIFFRQDFLRLYSISNDVHATGIYTGESILRIPSDSFMKGFFDSILPYFDEPDQMTESLAGIKTVEAIELLLRNPSIKNILFDFNVTSKIDLESFMNKYFTCNVPLVQFARLTGRSLSTFRRDFIKIFNVSPEKWLKKRRLEQAYYLISQRKKRPSDVYVEVGFESLSHFSTSFKKEYGHSPSCINP